MSLHKWYTRNANFISLKKMALMTRIQRKSFYNTIDSYIYMGRTERAKEYLYSVVEKVKAQPIKYPLRKGMELVRDYWDLAAVIAAGIAASDIEGNIFAESRNYVVAGGALASIYGPGIDALFITGRDGGMRFMRNLCAGLASFSCSGPFPIDMKISNTALLGLLSYFADKEYRRQESPQIQL